MLSAQLSSRKRGFVFLATVIVLALCSAAVAAGENGQNKTGKALSAEAPKSAATAGEAPAATNLSVTHHAVTVNGSVIKYTATAGYLHLDKKFAEHSADIFFVAYVKDGADKSARPVTFLFNGGPGASSLWLHLACAGPKRISRTFEGKPLSPPYSLEDNQYAWLDLTDLVFIDPVGSGYSRAAAGEDDKTFYGVKADVQSLAEFVRLYVTKEERWLSPKAIAGESYGTFRAVLVAEKLHEAFGLDVNALLLISPVLNFQTFSFRPGNDLPYVMFLPTYAAAASYHKKAELGAAPLGDLLRPVEEWALTEYNSALVRGDGLPEDRKKEITRILSSYTGLSVEYLENNNLRVRASRFARELLRSDNRTIGLLDDRFTSKGKTEDLFYGDPTFFGTLGALTAAMNDYVRKDLGYRSELPYDYLSRKANWSWDWGSASQGYAVATDDLSGLIRRAQFLKVFVAAGYYDLDVPYYASLYDINHLNLEPALRKNITMRFYEAGHQMYTDLPSLRKLKADVSEFFRGLLAGGGGTGETR